jgi:hypothetical protein
MEFRVIPIVLKNNGSVLNESIDIQLNFPNEIDILKPNDYPLPQRIKTLKELNSSKGILSLLLKHNKDSKVKEYSYSFSMPTAYLPNFPFSETHEEKKVIETNKYYDLIKSLFEYEIFYDKKDKTTIACNIDNIKPNDSVSLPCYLLTKSKEDFLIDYEINSKNLASKINGTLIVKSA